MFRVKICGITNPQDAQVAAAEAADAIGINFYSRSKRFVEPQAAIEIVQATPVGTLCVGVFVNESAAGIAQIVEQTGIGAVQLHGDESPELVGQLATLLGKTPVIRARRVTEDAVAAIAEDLQACSEAGRRPEAVLVDSPALGHYGGTGHTVDWPMLAGYRESLGDTPLILAGGLTPQNVTAAIETVRPAGVDVASGVESAPGQKDLRLVSEFVKAARVALG